MCMYIQAIASSDCILVSVKVSRCSLFAQAMNDVIKHITLYISWQFTQYPPVCPVQLKCSIPIIPHVPPWVTWSEVRAVFLYEESRLDADGSNACDPVNPIGGNTMPMPMVSLADCATFWLIVTYNCVHILWSSHNDIMHYYILFLSGCVNL